MDTAEIAERLVRHCRDGNYVDAIAELYAPNVRQFENGVECWAVATPSVPCAWGLCAQCFDGPRRPNSIRALAPRKQTQPWINFQAGYMSEHPKTTRIRALFAAFQGPDLATI